MLSRALRRQLGLETGVYAALGWILAENFAWSTRGAIALAITLFFAVRIALVAATFAMAWWRNRAPRRPRQRLAMGAWVKLFLSEAWAFIALFTVIQPFEKWLMGPDRLRRVRPGEHPVLLVHGYLCNRGAWRWLRARLERNGHCVATVNLEPPLASIDSYVDQLERRVDEVIRETGAEQVAVVAHSMGGLVVRAYLARHGALPVTRAITLGTPHQGSALAALGLGENARQMRPGNEWLRHLGSQRTPAGCALTSIHSCHDNFVMPWANQILDEADSVALSGIGHLSLLSSPQVATEIEHRLAATALTGT